MTETTTIIELPAPPADGRTVPHLYELAVAFVNELRLLRGIRPAAFAGELEPREIGLALGELRNWRVRNRLTRTLVNSWARARAAGENNNPPAREGATHDE